MQFFVKNRTDAGGTAPGITLKYVIIFRKNYTGFQIKGIISCLKKFEKYDPIL